MSAASKRLPVAPAAAPRWDFRKWGTLADPIHKSHMSSVVGAHACLEQFRRDRLAELVPVPRDSCSGKTEVGSAVHATIERALLSAQLRDAILAGKPATSPERVRSVLEAEFERCVGRREVRWYGKSEREKALAEGVDMVVGLFADMHRHVAKVELAEAGFIVALGDLWLEGHVDSIYRPTSNPDALAFTDWKTGAQKPHQIKLDHGYESGFYAHALAEGTFVPRAVVDAWRKLAQDDRCHEVPLDPWDATAIGAAPDDRQAMHLALRAVARKREATGVLVDGAVRFERFPEVIRLTHLRDYIPYAKKGDKAVTRPEDIEFWSRTLGREIKVDEKIKYEAGQWRGGAWLEVKRRPDDVPRLEKMLRSVVSWIRFGRFVAVADEMCTRCSYRGPCLTDGYELRGDDAKQLRDSLRGLDLADTNELSVDD